jgi:ribosome biogenesis GTPase A
LFHLLKVYRPSAAQSVTVGVVGFPNVGKSGLVSTLKWTKVRRRVFLGRIIIIFSIFGDGCTVVVKVCAVAA